jgi:hypothetical protein
MNAFKHFCKLAGTVIALLAGDIGILFSTQFSLNDALTNHWRVGKQPASIASLFAMVVMLMLMRVNDSRPKVAATRLAAFGWSMLRGLLTGSSLAFVFHLKGALLPAVNIWFLLLLFAASFVVIGYLDIRRNLRHSLFHLTY